MNKEQINNLMLRMPLKQVIYSDNVFNYKDVAFKGSNVFKTNRLL